MHSFTQHSCLTFIIRKHTNRVMQTVRAANTTKRFPKAIKAGHRPARTAKGGQSKPFDFSFATTPPADEQGRPPPSMDDLRAAVRRLSVSDNGKRLYIVVVHLAIQLLNDHVINNFLSPAFLRNQGPV